MDGFGNFLELVTRGDVVGVYEARLCSGLASALPPPLTSSESSSRVSIVEKLDDAQLVSSVAAVPSSSVSSNFLHFVATSKASLLRLRAAK